jgi:hypothetical protein
MDYDKPWHVLDIDISNAVRSDFDFENFRSTSEHAGKPVGIWFLGNSDLGTVFNSDWIDYMHQQGIKVNTALLFYRDPWYIHPEAHIDMYYRGGVCLGAINWTLDPNDDSEMTWYHMPEAAPADAVTPADTKYQSWPLSEIEPYQFSSRTIGTTPTLVHTGIPHNVIVRGRPRWVVSVRYADQHLGNWRNTVDFFQPWIKNVDC